MKNLENKTIVQGVVGALICLSTFVLNLGNLMMPIFVLGVLVMKHALGAVLENSKDKKKITILFSLACVLLFSLLFAVKK